MTQEQLLAIIKLGREMRWAQRLYFRTRTPANLALAKTKEQAFDLAAALVAEIERQPDLLA